MKFERHGLTFVVADEAKRWFGNGAAVHVQFDERWKRLSMWVGAGRDDDPTEPGCDPVGCSVPPHH